MYVDLSSFPTYVSSSPGTAAACFVGTSPRGPYTPTVQVNSWAEFTQWFGDFQTANPPPVPPNPPFSPLHLAVFSYFSAGGTSAVIIRAYRVGADGPQPASFSFSDQATTPVPTLQIGAANPGAWGNDLYIDISESSQISATAPHTPLTFTITVKYLGTLPSNVVEVWPNLTMSKPTTNVGTNNYAIDTVNSNYTGSKYITLTDLNSATTAPGNNPSPTPVNQVPGVGSVPASQQLAGGADGTPPDNPPPPSFTDYITAVELLGLYENQPVLLNLPGVTDTAVIGPIIGYSENRGNIFMVLDCPPGYLPQTMHDYAIGLSSTPQAAIYYPQVLISDPYSSVVGQTRLIPPGGFVTGLYIATDAARGIAKAPAGLGTSLLGVSGLEQTLTNTDQGLLTQANVNCIISIPGAGVVIWGARTLSPYLVTRYVPVERTLIYLSTELVAMTQFAVFEPNDWVLWNQVTSVLGQFLTSFWQTGGLSGQSASEAFFVSCDNTNNTPQTIQQGIINIQVGVALQYPAEFVVISIGQWAGGQSVTVTNP